LGPVTAHEASKSLELETRVGRIETALKKLRDDITVLNQRTVAIQAQLDHIAARFSRS
jgi:uncharacterized coiled-coil protein SlyX